MLARTMRGSERWRKGSRQLLLEGGEDLARAVDAEHDPRPQDRQIEPGLAILASRSRHCPTGPIRQIASSTRSLSASAAGALLGRSASAAKPLARNSR